jgi:hypothetical protein
MVAIACSAQVGLLAMMGGRRAFLPEVDLAIDADH